MVVPYAFEGLPVYRREEAELWNWYCHAFPSRQDWKGWAAEVLGHLLATPAGVEARLVVNHCLEPSQQKMVYPLRKPETLIGRNPDNDIVLAGPAITKRHALVRQQRGEYSVEDLGSTLGTYVGNKRLGPKQSCLLASGEQFTIFPYTVTLETQRYWADASAVEVVAGEARLESWRGFAAGSHAGMVPFSLDIHPPGWSACLELERAFLEQTVRRLLNPVQAQPEALGLLRSDHGLIEFLVLALLERANRDLAFPFRFLLGRANRRPSLPPDERGIAVACTVALPELNGGLRFFLTLGLLRGMRAAYAAPAGAAALPPVSWPIPISAGYADLRPDEAAGLECGDIVLLAPEVEVQLPGRTTRGWRAAWEGNAITLQAPFERRMLMADDVNRPPAPDLTQLPIRLHAVIGEKELTLAELGALKTGSILELNRDKSDPVDIALNGRLAGKGQLVEVEGKLGVRILSWSGVR